MKTIILAFALTILISACNYTTENPAKKSKDNTKDNPVEKQTQTPDFLKKYKQTTLPVAMKGCFGKSYSLPLISPDSLTYDNEDGILPYCTFKTNGDYYAAVRIGLADCALPILITYDKDGNVIDEKSLGIGMGGFGPGYSCEEFTIIKSDFTIYSSDTISEAKTDSLGREIKGTKVTYVIYKKGRLLSSGKIELSDTLRKNL